MSLSLCDSVEITMMMKTLFSALILFAAAAALLSLPAASTADGPFIVAHKNGTLSRLKSGVEGVSVSIDIYNQGSACKIMAGLLLHPMGSLCCPSNPPWTAATRQFDDIPCHWTEISCMNVTCSTDPRVVGISVAGRSLVGYIPSELSSLTYLRRLNLHGNNLHGSIPDELFNASSLHSIFLYDNNLSGLIPPSTCNPQRIQNVDFSHNSLSGPLNKELKNCQQLERLILAGNKFSGTIPKRIFPELANLEQLDLSSNSFDGPIPDDQESLWMAFY